MNHRRILGWPEIVGMFASKVLVLEAQEELVGPSQHGNIGRNPSTVFLYVSGSIGAREHVFPELFLFFCIRLPRSIQMASSTP